MESKASKSVGCFGGDFEDRELHAEYDPAGLRVPKNSFFLERFFFVVGVVCCDFCVFRVFFPCVGKARYIKLNWFDGRYFGATRSSSEMMCCFSCTSFVGDLNGKQSHHRKTTRHHTKQC